MSGQVLDDLLISPSTPCHFYGLCHADWVLAPALVEDTPFWTLCHDGRAGSRSCTCARRLSLGEAERSECLEAPIRLGRLDCAGFYGWLVWFCRNFGRIVRIRFGHLDLVALFA